MCDERGEMTDRSALEHALDNAHANHDDSTQRADLEQREEQNYGEQCFFETVHGVSSSKVVRPPDDSRCHAPDISSYHLADDAVNAATGQWADLLDANNAFLQQAGFPP